MNRLLIVGVAVVSLGTLALIPVALPFAKDFVWRVMNKLQIDIVDPDDIPPSPVLTPDEALKSMVVQKPFTLELVASEPLVFSPVAVAFDEKGRLWACEMVTYMPNVNAEGEEIAGNSIAFLTDTDGNGQFDQRTVFLDGIVLPRAIAMVANGILYADQQSLYFAEVLPDDSVGINEVVDPLYAQGGNVEYKANGLVYGLDGWYYSALSDWKYKLFPLDAAIPEGSEQIYENIYWKIAKAPTSYRGQWGMSIDDTGRLFYNGNSSPPKGEILRADLLNVAQDEAIAIPAFDIGSRSVYTARVNPGVNRGYRGRNTLITSGPDKGKLREFTAAGGSVVYRGTALPEEYYGIAITTEPAGNLISARRVIDQETELSGESLFSEKEVLASTDERFRPVNLENAPDGSLYVVDMYHGIIQHKTYLSDYLEEQILSRDLERGNSATGRIYRLSSTSSERVASATFSSLSLDNKVAALGHPDAWWRDTARRHIVQNRIMEAAPLMKTDLVAKNDWRAQVNILWSLAGLDMLESSEIELALQSDYPQVRSAGLAVLNEMKNVDEEWASGLILAHASDTYAVALEAAAAAHRFSDPAIEIALMTILANHDGKPLVEDAIAVGANGKEVALMNMLDRTTHSSLIARLEQRHETRNDRPRQSRNNSLSDKQYLAGQELFLGKGGCSGCHGRRGEGIDGLGPPLKSSEWVMGSDETLATILLFGVRGKIVVNGITYDPGVEMAGAVVTEELSDEELAQIVYYIRNSWGHDSPGIDVEVFQRTRTKYPGRTEPFEASELEP